jgi:hypothetical protein
MGLDVSHVVPSPKTTGPLEYFTVAELSSSPGFIERHHALVVQLEEEEGHTKGIYFQEKGYQRKGMNGKFYQDFENGRPYFDLQSVLEAYECLEADHIHTLKELQQNF